MSAVAGSCCPADPVLAGAPAGRPGGAAHVSAKGREEGEKKREAEAGERGKRTGGGDPHRGETAGRSAQNERRRPHIAGLDGFTTLSRPPPKGPEVILGWEPGRGMQPSNRRQALPQEANARTALGHCSKGATLTRPLVIPEWDDELRTPARGRPTTAEEKNARLSSHHNRREESRPALQV